MVYDDLSGDSGIPISLSARLFGWEDTMKIYRTEPDIWGWNWKISTHTDGTIRVSQENNQRGYRREIRSLTIHGKGADLLREVMNGERR